MEIGSFFEFPEFDCKNEEDSVYRYLRDVPHNQAFLRDGRQAIKAVLSNTDKDKVCYLPAYLCHSILQPFKELELTVKFYGMVPMVSDSIVFIIDYFGTESGISNKGINTLLDKGNIVIMDITHSIFSKTRFEIQHENYYLIASLRKVFPIPDGGIVYHTNTNFTIEPTSPSGYGMMTEVMKFKASSDKKYYMDIYREYEDTKESKAIPQQSIPDISIEILKNLNFLNILSKRSANLDYLYQNINWKWVFMYDKREDIKSPFFLPLLFKTQKQRDDVKSKLIKEKIYPPIHWKLPEEVPEKFAYERYLSDRILSIPIDQRYGKKEMKRIATVLNEVLN